MKNTLFNKTFCVTTLIALIFIVYRTEAVPGSMVLKKDDLSNIANELYKKMALSASKENLSTINSTDDSPNNTASGSQQIYDKNHTQTHTTITEELNHLALWKKNATNEGGNTLLKEDPKSTYSVILDGLGKIFTATAIHSFIRSNSAAVNDETPEKTRGCFSRKKAKKAPPEYYSEELVNLILRDIKNSDEFSTESTPNDNLHTKLPSSDNDDDQAESKSVHSGTGLDPSLHEVSGILLPKSGLDDNIPTNEDDDNNTSEHEDNTPVDEDDATSKSDIDGTEQQPLIGEVDGNV